MLPRGQGAAMGDACVLFPAQCTGCGHSCMLIVCYISLSPPIPLRWWPHRTQPGDPLPVPGGWECHAQLLAVETVLRGGLRTCPGNLIVCSTGIYLLTTVATGALPALSLSLRRTSLPLLAHRLLCISRFYFL